MPRSSIIANLGKMLTVQAHLRDGATLTRACKAAGTSSGTYRKWQARYAEPGLPIAVAPLSDRGAFKLSSTAQHLFLADEDDTSLHLTRIDTATGTRLTHQHKLLRPGHYRTISLIAPAPDGSRALLLLGTGELLWWIVDADEVLPCDVDLTARGVQCSDRSSSGVRRWGPAAVSADLTHLAYWQTDDEDRERRTLHVVRLDDDTACLSRVVPDHFISPPIVLHPTRPLVGVLDTNSLIILLNYETDTVLIEDGPQVHSISFSLGDTLLYDDWYGKTRRFNYATDTNEHLTAGWGSQASLSTRFLTATHQAVHLHDTEDATWQRTLPFDNIQECALSVDGRYLVVYTDHVGIWKLT